MRSVVRRDGFDLQASAIFGSVMAADKALRAVEFALAREPDLSILPIVDVIGDVDVRSFGTIGTSAVPACIVLFTFDAQIVTLLSVITVDDRYAH